MLSHRNTDTSLHMRVHGYALNKMILQILFLINVNAFFFFYPLKICVGVLNLFPQKQQISRLFSVTILNSLPLQLRSNQNAADPYHYLQLFWHRCLNQNLFQLTLGCNFLPILLRLSYLIPIPQRVEEHESPLCQLLESH